MTEKIPVSNESLCKTCKYRHRRVSLVSNPSEYVDTNGMKPFEDAEDAVILISNFCLVNGMEIGGEITIDCSNYKEKDKDDSPVKYVGWRPE